MKEMEEAITHLKKIPVTALSCCKGGNVGWESSSVGVLSFRRSCDGMEIKM